MPRNLHRKKRLTALTEINITPLIDLALALLMIFMIISPLLEQYIPVNLPIESPKEQETIKPNNIKVVTIDDKGDYYRNSTLTTPNQLNHKFKIISVQKEQPIIDIRAEATISYQKVVTVLDLKKTGLPK